MCLSIRNGIFFQPHLMISMLRSIVNANKLNKPKFDFNFNVSRRSMSCSHKLHIKRPYMCVCTSASPNALLPQFNKLFTHTQLVLLTVWYFIYLCLPMCHFSSIVFGFICVLYRTAQYSTAPIALCRWCLNDCLWYRVIFFVYVRFDSFQPYILIHFNAFALRTRNSWQNKHWNIWLGRNEMEKKKNEISWKERPNDVY